MRTFLVWSEFVSLVTCSERHLHGRVRALLAALETWGNAAQVRVATLREELVTACRNASEIERAAWGLLVRPRRSSSPV